jgi:hypothetical protein
MLRYLDWKSLPLPRITSCYEFSGGKTNRREEESVRVSQALAVFRNVLGNLLVDSIIRVVIAPKSP